VTFSFLFLANLGIENEDMNWKKKKMTYRLEEESMAVVESWMGWTPAPICVFFKLRRDRLLSEFGTEQRE
jgi:hypothetical protein